MRSTGIIDANILLRAVVGDIPEQAAAVNQLLDSIATGDLTGYVPITVVQEFVFVLERFYDASRVDIAQSIQDLVNIANLTVEHSEDLIDCLDNYVQRRSNSFPEAFHWSLAKHHHAGNLISLDQALSRIPGINRIEPETAQP